MSTGDLLGTLHAFAQKVPRQSSLEAHLRYPARLKGTLRGSVLGAELWSTAEGQRLFQVARELLGFGETHDEETPPTVGPEIHGRIASFFGRGMESADLSRFIEDNATILSDEFQSDRRDAEAMWVVDGVQADRMDADVAPFLRILPLDEDSLSALEAIGLIEDLVTVPKASSAVVWAYGRSTDWQFGTGAVLGAEMALRNFAQAVWLVTGLHPRWYVRTATELARFPTLPPVHETRSSFGRSGNDLSPARRLPMPEAREVFWRLHDRSWLWAVDGYEETLSEAMRASYYLLDAADQVLEGPLLMAITFASMEGLLASGESDSLFVRRASRIFGRSQAECRMYRKLLDAAREVRNAVAHGKRPTWSQIERLLGTRFDDRDVVDRWDSDRETTRRALNMLRSCFGTVLMLTVKLEPIEGGFRTVPDRTQLNLLSLLDLPDGAMDAATRAAAETQLSAAIPSWARHPIGPAPK